MNFTLRTNAISEASFVVYEKENEKYNSFYPLLVKNRLLKFDNVGWFQIRSTSEDDQGEISCKTINAYSYEATLNQKSVNLLDGTYKFYDPVDPDETILGKILKRVPSWKIGHVDSSLWNKYRTFDLPESTIYNFLMKDVEEAYECIVEFDNGSKTINVYDPRTYVKETDIILTYQNLLNQVEIKEEDEGIVTALGVYGDKTLDISSVNPLGNNIIYNFNYYKDPQWMDQGLIDKINIWENKIENAKSSYSELLVNLNKETSARIKLDSELVDLNAELERLERTQSIRVEHNSGDLTEITAQVEEKKRQIANKQSEAAKTKDRISALNARIKGVSDSVSLDSNFTLSELAQLDDFIHDGTYTNNNYIATEEMNELEVRDVANELYKVGLEMSAKMSQPQYSFSLESGNFLFIQKFKPFIDQLQFGAMLNVEVKKGVWVNPVLLEIQLDYDNPEKLTMKFANRFRLSDTEWTLGEFFNNTSLSSSKVDINSNSWGKPTNSGWYDKVSEYMSNSLDLAAQKIINSTDQEFILDQTGLRGRKKLSNGTFDPSQFWITHNLMAFTDDNWQHSKLALGNISTPSGGWAYGLNAEVIAGNMVCSNDLYISNEKNSVRINGDGAVFTDCSLTVTSNNSRTILSPSSGLTMQKKNGSSWTNTLYTDYSGNLTLNGRIIAKSGTIGGWNISDSQLSDNHGNYFNSNGTFKLGLLRSSNTQFSVGSWLTINSSGAWFNGNVYAPNIQGQIVNSQIGNSAISSGKIAGGAVGSPQIASRAVGGGHIGGGAITPYHVSYLSADDITTGSLTADRIYGGSMSFHNGGQIGETYWGSSTMVVGYPANGGSYVQLNSNGILRLSGRRLMINGSQAYDFYSGSSGITITDINKIYIKNGIIVNITWK